MTTPSPPRCGQCTTCQLLDARKPKYSPNPPFSHAGDESVRLWNEILLSHPCDNWTYEQRVRVALHAFLHTSPAVRPSPHKLAGLLCGRDQPNGQVREYYQWFRPHYVASADRVDFCIPDCECRWHEGISYDPVFDTPEQAVAQLLADSENEPPPPQRRTLLQEAVEDQWVLLKVTQTLVFDGYREQLSQALVEHHNETIDE